MNFGRRWDECQQNIFLAIETEVVYKYVHTQTPNSVETKPFRIWCVGFLVMVYVFGSRKPLAKYERALVCAGIKLNL